MDGEGFWGGLIVILLVLVFLKEILHFIGTVLGYIGQTFLILLEHPANGFAALGVTNPIAAWVLLGLVLGAAVGAIIGFGQIGMTKARNLTLVGSGVVLVLLLAISPGVPSELDRGPTPIGQAPIVTPGQNVPSSSTDSGRPAKMPNASVNNEPDPKPQETPSRSVGATPPVQRTLSPSVEELAKQVEAEIDSGNYDRALLDAEQAVRLYPRSDRARALVQKVRRIRSILN